MTTNYEYFKSAAKQWNVIFKRDNEWMKKNGYPIAVYSRFVINGDIVSYIIVSNNFFKLTNGTQQFVYTHELGHHFQHINNTHHTFNELELECDADNYARTRVGGSKYAIKALQELQWAAEKLHCNEGVKEIQKRIDFIQQSKVKTF